MVIKTEKLIKKTISINKNLNLNRFNEQIT